MAAMITATPQLIEAAGITEHTGEDRDGVGEGADIVRGDLAVGQRPAGADHDAAAPTGKPD